MKGRYIPSLNGIRAVSILMVVGYHLNQRGFLPHTPLTKYGGWFLFNGPMGVNIFFIISGFLITNLLISEREEKGDVSLKQFYIRRSFRIFPAYYVFLLVIYILQLFNYLHTPPEGWFSFLTYTRQFFPFYEHETAHLWSLSVEEVFYLFWPLCFLKIKNHRLFLLVSIILITLCRFIFFNYPSSAFTNTIFTTGDAVLIGCLVAVNLDFFKRLVVKFNSRVILLPILLIGSIVIYNYLYSLGSSSSEQDRSYLSFFQKTAYALFGNIGLFTNLIIALIIVYCIYSRSIIYRLLNTAILNYIGLLSYSIYLWQQLYTADRIWLHKLPFIVIIALIACTALLSYYVIEKPFLKIKERHTHLKGIKEATKHSIIN